MSGSAHRRAGALILGANLRALGVARSLGRRGIPVWVLPEPGGDTVARRSRHVSRCLPAPAGGAEAWVAGLPALAGPLGPRWTLFATEDEAMAAIARRHAQLGQSFALTSPGWDAVQHAYHKRLTYELARRLGIAHPWTAHPRSAGEAESLPCPFPAVLKPDAKPVDNPFTRAKAWRVDDRPALRAAWAQAAALVGTDGVMVQELIPGGGESQYSFAALCHAGTVVASLTARRLRQYPRDFGHSSSLVETLDEPAVERPGRALIAALGWTGLIELEFKRDARDGTFRLLDINGRAWTWHALGARAGVEFPYLAWRLSQGLPVSPVRAPPGVRWVRLVTDIPSALGALRAGELSPGDWLASLRGPRQAAVWAADDPLPAVVDTGLVAGRTARRLVTGRTVSRLATGRAARRLVAGRSVSLARRSGGDRRPGARGEGGDRRSDARDLLRRQAGVDGEGEDLAGERLSGRQRRWLRTRIGGGEVDGDGVMDGGGDSPARQVAP